MLELALTKGCVHTGTHQALSAWAASEHGLTIQVDKELIWWRENQLLYVLLNTLELYLCTFQRYFLKQKCERKTWGRRAWAHSESRQTVGVWLSHVLVLLTGYIHKSSSICSCLFNSNRETQCGWECGQNLELICTRRQWWWFGENYLSVMFYSCLSLFMNSKEPFLEHVHFVV